MKQEIYDIAGIGIGPFNLGLAALSSEIGELKTIFFDKTEVFNWHAGMMLDGTRLQVPFHADLVTQVNPQSKYSFLSYLKAKRRLYRFTILEEYFPLRKEYNDYLKWVIASMNNLCFGCYCNSVTYNYGLQCYELEIRRGNYQPETYYAKQIVLGVGAVPNIPAACRLNNDAVFHSSDYLHKKESLKNKQDIMVVGSGQSAAEIFNDLLEPCWQGKQRLSWYTGSWRFFPMDYSKFSLELTSPDYIDHFFCLADGMKNEVLARQSILYKGINNSLIDAIYNKLYMLSLDGGLKERILLKPNCRITGAAQEKGRIQCLFEHKEAGRTFSRQTDALILATGYSYKIPECLKPIAGIIQWDKQNRYKVNRNYSVDKRNSIFVQNGEMHTHGFNAPDLGMGPYRNAVILNAILGHEYFQTEDEVPFQAFG